MDNNSKSKEANVKNIIVFAKDYTGKKAGQEIQETMQTLKKAFEIPNIYKKISKPIIKVPTIEIPDPLAKLRSSFAYTYLEEIKKAREADRLAVQNNLYVIQLEQEVKDLEYQLKDANTALQELKQKTLKVSKELAGISETVITETPKPKKVLYVDDEVISWERIEIAMQAGLNYLLFENSVRTQWIDIFNGKTPSNLIQIKEGITLKIFCYVLDQFAEKGVIKKRYTTTLTNLQAFG